MTDIHIILTGGTIEKSYDPLTERPEFKSTSIIPDYLAQIVKAYPAISFETLCQIDSLQMTEEIRARILARIQACRARRILIIHGTSTMQDTARYLEENLGAHDKTIILTGAMIPMKEFAMSDGGFNLGYAIAALEYKQSGIYLCMNARCFSASSVVKNTDLGRFEEA